MPLLRRRHAKKFKKLKKLLLILALLINSPALPQAVNTLKIDSLYSSDGPVVIHENGNIFEAGILPGGGTFTMYKKSISVGDTLSCYVDETGQSFNFTLKDKIEAEKDVYEMPSKMLMVSDIEGNFNGFQMILKGAGVIDENFRWTFGAGHLVIDGDMFDRSLNVTECLWLIYKLEGEAENAGGKVHFVMGNHDVMNLKGDYRYLRKKYLINADSLKIPYSSWYSGETELGRWLRSKNCIERIGNILFVHGGIGGAFPFSKYTLGEINAEFRKRLDLSLTKKQLKEDLFLGSASPVWYRGIAESKAAPEQVDSVLTHFGAEIMILGHTILDTIKFLYGSKVITIDLEHKQNSDNGFMKALYYDSGNFYIIDNKSPKRRIKIKIIAP